MFKWTRHPIVRCLQVAAFGLAISTQVHAAIPASERQALMDLYASASGDTWSFNDNWNGPPGTECTWFGVVCNDDQTHVTMISLATFAEMTFGMAGHLPESLHDLTWLESFDINMNLVGGQIPSLSGMTQLRIFDVRHNLFEGPLPSLIGLPALEYFQVDDNFIGGPFPHLEDLPNLIAFTASNNWMSGSIPSLDGLSSLRAFRIDNNRFSGNLPPFPSAVADASGSVVCPNAFNHTQDPSWDFATGLHPWYRDCPLSETIFDDGFD
jgi:hypothetical protein